MRGFVLILCLLAGVAAAQPTAQPWRASTAEERASDASAFEGVDEAIRQRLTDVQSAAVVLQGRTIYAYHRDGYPNALRDTQSVAKTALVALVGAAMQQGAIASLDQPVVELVNEWRNQNQDPRAASITLRHLLSMTAGFEVDDATGTEAPRAPEVAWARPLRFAPGVAFAYDNSALALVVGVLEKIHGKPLRDIANALLAERMDMAEPSYAQGLHLRTIDMTKLGVLFLRDGNWGGQPLLPPGFAAQTTRAVTAGGPPVRMPYGLSWWLPSNSTFFASGYAGQFIWVHRPLDLVIAVTSTVSAGSQQRGQALQLIRGRLFQAAQARAALAR